MKMTLIDEAYSAHMPVWSKVRSVDTLGWEPLSKKVYDDMGAEIPEWQRIVRSDNNYVLHMPRDSYHVITNTQMYSLRDALMENGAVVDTLSEVNSGRKVFCVLHLDEPLIVEGDRTLTFPYFIIINTFDGSGALQVLPMMGRLSCWNMMPAIVRNAREAGLYIKFKHTASASIKIEEARAILQDVRKLSHGYVDAMNRLTEMKVDASDTAWFVTKFIPLPEDPDALSDRQANNIISNRNLLSWTIDNSRTLEGVRGTAYGLYQAGIEYLDHMRGSRGGTDGLVSRTILKVDPLKYKAYHLAVEAAKN
jgi:phage/plasmid-like protein (TIGR03299 family)